MGFAPGVKSRSGGWGGGVDGIGGDVSLKEWNGQRRGLRWEVLQGEKPGPKMWSREGGDWGIKWGKIGWGFECCSRVFGLAFHVTAFWILVPVAAHLVGLLSGPVSQGTHQLPFLQQAGGSLLSLPRPSHCFF